MKKVIAAVVAVALVVLFAHWLGGQRDKYAVSRARAERAAREAQAKLDSSQGGSAVEQAGIDYEAKPAAAPGAVNDRLLSPAERESLKAREREFYTTTACPETRETLAELEAMAARPDSMARLGHQRMPAEELSAATERARTFIARHCSR